MMNHRDIPGRKAGPVTLAIAAMREDEPPRRTVLQAAAALVGTIIGVPLHRGAEPDLTLAAENWLCEARALGMLVMMQPDGHIYRTVPIYDGKARAKAREEHWVALSERPRLRDAVYAAAERGFVPEVR